MLCAKFGWKCPNGSTNLNPLNPGILCGKFGWTWPNGSGEENCWMLSIISPLGRAWPFFGTNLNHLNPRMLCAKFDWKWSSGSEKKILKCSQCIFTISQLLPLWEGCGPFFEQCWISFTQKCFVPSFVEVGQVVLEKKFF